MIQRWLPCYSRLLKLAVPFVLTQAGQMSVRLIDNAMIGHYGTAEFEATSFANSIYIETRSRRDLVWICSRADCSREFVGHSDQE